MKVPVTKSAGRRARQPSRRTKASPMAKATKTGGLVSLALLMVAAVGMFWVWSRLNQAEDLNDIHGREEVASSSVRDLASRMNLYLSRGDELVITEAEVNHFLQHRLELKQGGLFENRVEVEGAWVRFKPDYVELVIERRIGDRPHTVAMRYAYKKEDGRAEHGFLGQEDLGSGSSARFGRLGVPGGGVRLLLPALKEVRQALAQELDLVQKMDSVRIEEDQIVLQPRAVEG